MLEKRLAQDDGPAPKRERVALDELSEEGPLSQSDVVYFKKEAIWRQMKTYKAEVKRLETQLLTYQERAEHAQQVAVTLDAWYAQLAAAAGGADDGVNFLLATGTEALDNRRAQLEGATAKPSASADDVLAQLGTVQAALKKLEVERAQLTSRVEALETALQKFEKALDRDASKTLERVFGQPAEEEVKVEETTNGAAEETVTDQATTEQVEKLEIEVEELKTETTALRKQVEAAETRARETATQLADATLRLELLTEDTIKATPWYAAVSESNHTLQQQVRELQTVHESTTSKIQQLEATLNASGTNTNDNDDMTALKQQLQKAETDLVRIRAARDELLAKNAVLKAEAAASKSHTELVALNKSLLAKIERLHQDKPQELDAALASLSSEALVAKVLGLQEEIKEVEAAFNDTRKLALTKVALAAEHETAIKRLNVEKTKAEQKYFSAMRLKDAVQLENKLLKAQVAKSQEVIKAGQDVEKGLAQKIEVLTKQMSDFQQIKETAIRETQGLTDQLVRAKKIRDASAEDVKKARARLDDQALKIASMQSEESAIQVAHAKLELKLKATETLLKKYQQANPSLVVEDEQEIEGLRSMAKCSVCLKNWKDTAITVCGHVFCHHCTEERLAARLRRCPSCNKGFSANDLLLIHL